MSGKFFVLTILLLAVAANCEFDYAPAETNELKFLGGKPDPGVISIEENCANGAVFVNTRTKVSPQKITRGQTIDIKIIGQSKKDLQADHIQVIAKLNGVESFKETKPFKQEVKPGVNTMYEYSTAVPTFIPEGTFEIFVYIVDNQGNNDSCLKASFDF